MNKARGTAYGLTTGTRGMNASYKFVPRAPRTTDTAFPISTIWLDTLDNNVYFLVGFEAGIPLWRSLVSSGTDFKDSVLSIAIATNPPPTSNVGDRYIIDNSGPVNGAWGVNVSNNDIVEFNGNSWDHDEPSEGALVYVEDVDLLYIFNGTEWEDISNAIPSASETQRGVLRISTDGEAISSVVTDEALVPSNLIPVFSSPNPIGDTIPNTAGFTQIDMSPVTAPAHEPGRLFYDTDTDALTFYNSESDISLQIGEENWIKVRNETGDELTNGTIVYLNGSSGGIPLIEKAIASDHDASHALGVVTHVIEDNTEGYVTSFGLVRGLNTNTFAGGEAIFLSATVEGGVTITPPTNKDFIVRIGFIAAVGVSDGSFLVNIEHAGNIEFSHGYTNNPVGFLDPETDVEISFVDGTRTFTIAPQGDSFSYWAEGIRYDKTAPEDIIVPDTNGLHYIYYVADTLTISDTFNDDFISKYAFVSVVDWNVAEAKNIYIADEFKHTTKMSSKTHSYLHNTRGFALSAGGALTDIVADGDGNLDSSAQFGNGATIAWDEDARFPYLARTSTENIGIYYKEGPQLSFVWNVNEITNFGVLTTGTGRAAYNELSGGTWVQTEVPNNQFLLAHVFVYNDSGRKYGLVQGEEAYATISNARDGAEIELSNIVLAGRVPQELKFLGTIIYQTSDVYGNTVKSRIRTTDGGFDYIDLRDETVFRGGTGGTISDHGALSGLSDDDHLQYLLTDGSRTLTGPMDFGSQSLTNVNIDSGSATGLTEVQVDNISIDGNTISATGDLILAPTGITILEASSYSALDTMQDSVNAFPVGTENSLLKANIKGLSLYQSVVNGDFSGGTTGYSSGSATLAVVGNDLEITATSTVVVVVADIDMAFEPGRSQFSYLKFESDTAMTSFTFSIDGSTGGAITGISQELAPAISTDHEMYGITLEPADFTGILQFKIAILDTTIGSKTLIKGGAGVFAIDMTNLGITSYTEAQMLDIVQQGYFVGYQASVPEITTAHILAENSIINGDFSDGANNWTKIALPLTVTITDKLVFNGIETETGGYIQDIAASTTDSIFVAYFNDYTSGDAPNVTVRDFGTFDNATEVVTVDGWNGVIVSGKIDGVRLYFRALDTFTYNSTIDNIFTINMTATGIEDKTEAEMLEFVQTTGYFEGEQADRSNTFNPAITLQSLPDGTQDTLQNASDDLSNLIDNWRHTQIVSDGEPITSATVVNTTNFPDMVTGSSFLIVLDAGGIQTGVDGDSADANGTVYYQLADMVVSEITLDQLYSFKDGYLYQQGTLLNQIDFSVAQNITARLDNLEHAIEDLDDIVSNVPQTLTDDVTISWDSSVSRNAIVTLEDNRTLGNPTNVVSGDVLKIIVKQDTIGSRTLAYDTNFKFAGGSAPTLTTAVDAVDVLEFFCEDSSTIYLTNTTLNLS